MVRVLPARVSRFPGIGDFTHEIIRFRGFKVLIDF
jgi:hypothetical protein